MPDEDAELLHYLNVGLRYLCKWEVSDPEIFEDNIFFAWHWAMERMPKTSSLRITR